MIHNPTMDAEKFARQFSRIRERDAERASCSRNAHAQAEAEALRSMSCSEFYEAVTGRKLSGAAKAVLDTAKPKPKPLVPIPATLRGTTPDFVIVDDVVTP